MKNPFDYSVSLRVTHPTWTATEISRRLKRSPKYSWTVGDPRMTPKGAVLEGRREYSYCSFDIGRGLDGELADCLRRAIDGLKPTTADLQALRSSGGSLLLFVFWQANGDTGEVFEPDLLFAIASLGIELGINVFDDRGAFSDQPSETRFSH